MAHPSNARSIIGSASTEIRQAIHITENQAMDFGVLVMSNGNGDTLSLSPDGSITNTNGNVSPIGNTQYAVFSASGTPNTPLSISFQNGSLTGNSNTITLHNFNHNAGTSPTFNNSGTLTFHVGADLEVNANQETGSYSGNYQVTINYQ
ncbi:MAG: DUF4402 domain-containing protein [Alphaproteobacteria bacterium]